MPKMKLTKNELKKQKDALKMFRRYLPTLMLKKQQLQAEIRTTEIRLWELKTEKDKLDEAFKSWIAVFGEEGFFSEDFLKIVRIDTDGGRTRVRPFRRPARRG